MDIIVIGCGASGIAAMRFLHNAGLKVLGLEAADRIGGRIHTINFGNCAIDLGAAWADDEVNNAVLDLTKPFELLERELPDHTSFLLSNGNFVSDEHSEILKELGDIVSNAHTEITTPVPEYIEKSIATSTMYRNDTQLYNSIKEWFMRANYIGGNNDPIRGRSVKSLKEFSIKRDHMLHWKGKGYKTILDILLNKYPDPSKGISSDILLNKEVENIKWLSKNESGKSIVQVECKDGSVYEAKSVIVTLSIGVLKERHTTLFNPSLPQEKVNTINNLELGVLGKVYIEFTKPWWTKIPSSFFILWQEEDKKQLSDNEEWITGVFGIETVAYQPNLLLAWTYEVGAAKMEEASDESIEAGIKKLMEIVFKKQYDVTPVKAFIRSKWGSNPLIRGSFSYRSVAMEKYGGSRDILREPLYNEDKFPVLCFAGEATSDKCFSSVHGAIDAGYREAKRLIEQFKSSENSYK